MEFSKVAQIIFHFHVSNKGIELTTVILVITECFSMHLFTISRQNQIYFLGMTGEIVFQFERVTF
jgi:hypothetical protein